MGVQLLCLPELCISGYGCEDAFLSKGLQSRSLKMLAEIARSCSGIAVAVGLPLAVEGVLYNVAALIADREILGFVGKQNLAGEGIYYEPRWFKPWPRGVTKFVKLGKREIPVGDLYFELDGVRVGFEVCEDAWVEDRPAARLLPVGVQVLLNPSASHFAFGKNDVRRKLIFNRIKSSDVAYIYSNLLGCDSGRIIFDGDCFIGSQGKISAQSARFSFKEYTIVAAVVQLKKIGRIKAVKGSPYVVRKEVNVLNSTSIAESVHRSPFPSWERSQHLKEEEFTRAVILGLFDYLRKSRSHGFVVSLSGGVDSSAAASLVKLMICEAYFELGRDVFLDRLNHISDLVSSNSPTELCHRLLTCVYQASKNSSKETRHAANSVAEELGARYVELNISSLVSDYTEIVSKALERKISWKTDDIALQNIQARVRSPSVWLIANLQRALLLTTSNRSEAAVGYTTMDGDTSGGLSPLGGIDKAFLRRWCNWLQRIGPIGMGRVVNMKHVTRMPPTAELRPKGSNQTDEGDLMPYEVLDQIERFAIRDKLTPVEVFTSLQKSLVRKYAALQLGLWVEKFFRLWSINQWKRERYAPSFHLDDENLDPKTWCRFPILSGGFELELQELRAVLSNFGLR